MMRAQNVGKNLMFASATLVIFVLVLEVALQFVLPLVYRPRFTKIDATLGWTHKASVGTKSTLEGHTFRDSYNSHGYRWPEHSVNKPAGKLRVAMLGDSFVDGSEVGDQELMTWHLQQAMKDVDVVNFGVYGYSTAQESLTLEHVALSFDPDLVVLVTVPNDFSGNLNNVSFFGPAPRYMLSGDSLVYESTRSAEARATFRATNLPVPGMTFLHEHSLVYYFLNHFIYQRFTGAKIQSLLEAQMKSISPADQVELYRRIVRHMKQLCDARGVGFLVVLSYEKSNLHPGPDSPAAQLVNLLQSDGVSTLDLYKPLRDAEQAADSSYFYKEDIHWNVRGHRLVANLLRPPIEQWLRDHRQLVDSRPTAGPAAR